MPFTKEDKILIKNLLELKGYNARHLVKKESFPEKAKMSAASTNCCNSYGLLVICRPGSGRWRSVLIDLVDELVLHKNG